MNKLLTILLALNLFAVKAQTLNFGYESRMLDKILNSTLHVVLTGREAYDEAIREAADKYWKVTPVEYISVADINNHVQDESKSFLLPFVMTIYVDKGSDYKSYSQLKSWLVVVPGGKKKFNKYTDADVVSFAPFDYYGEECEFERSGYRLEYMVKGMNDAIERTVQQKITGNAMTTLTKVMDAMNSRAKEMLKKRTLVINKDLRSWKTEKSIVEEEVFKTGGYPYQYIFVNDEEFKELMKGDSDEYLLLVPAIEIGKHILVYDPATRSTVYYGMSLAGMSLTRSDIKDLAEGKR